MAAQSLEKSAAIIQNRIEAAEAALTSIEEAMASARAEIEAQEKQADSLALDAVLAARAALPEGHSDFQMGVQFLHVDLAATRKLAKSERGAWKIGDAFTLEPEPDNAVDPFAIKLMRAGKCVGYVAAQSAREIHDEKLAAGWTLSGRGFLHARAGGHWNEGQLMARMESPVVGWRGYNPSLPLGPNIASMEQALLNASSSDPSSPPPSVKKRSL